MDDIAEILSLLPVKSLMRFRCVSKSFDTLICDPYFVQMHLKKSKLNPQPQLTLTLKPTEMSFYRYVVTFPISGLLENSLTTVKYDPYYDLKKNDSRWWVVGSCNGLLCLADAYGFKKKGCWYLWNPASRTKSSEFFPPYLVDYFWYSFGYDNSSGTYKVVAFRIEYDKEHGIARSMVKVLSVGDNSWRNIQCFDEFPIYMIDSSHNRGVYLNGTINWLALRGYKYLNDHSYQGYSSATVEQHVIVSLDLCSETFTQLFLPRGFNKVPYVCPILVVLMECLSFCHDLEETHLVIWQMKDFGDEGSWIQIFKISYQSFSSFYKYLGTGSIFRWLELVPLCLSKNGDTLILANRADYRKAFIHNCRDNRAEQIRITNDISWLYAMYYMESMVSAH